MSFIILGTHPDNRTRAIVFPMFSAATVIALLSFAFWSSQCHSGVVSMCKKAPYSGDELSIPVYWISSPKGKERRRYMEKQLRDIGLSQRAYRINAILPSSSSFNITRLETPCKRNTKKDAACVVSHLKAIYTAIYNPYNQRNMTSKWGSGSSLADSEYALILEDDVEFKFKVNFRELIRSVSDKNFGILQLVTSNIEAVDSLWDSFGDGAPDAYWSLSKWSDRSRDGKTALYWSTQAYIINKRVVRALIDDVIDEYIGIRILLIYSASYLPPTFLYVDLRGHIKISFKLISSFSVNNCRRTKKYPCVLCNCLFADSYIYSGAGPTYVSKLPLFNGADVGLTSEMHSDHISVHSTAFNRIADIQKKIVEGIGNSSRIPGFIQALRCD